MARPSEDFAARGRAVAERAGERNATGVVGMSTGFGDLVREEETKALSWIKVPAQRHLDLVILSPDPTRYEVHWDAAGRGVYCVGVERGCALCARRAKPEARYCFCVLDQSCNVRCLIELGAAPCLAIQAALQSGGRLRGLMIRLSKEGGRYKGRMLIEIRNSVVNPLDLPSDVAISPHLVRQYGLGADGSPSGAVEQVRAPGPGGVMVQGQGLGPGTT